MKEIDYLKLRIKDIKGALRQLVDAYSDIEKQELFESYVFGTSYNGIPEFKTYDNLIDNLVYFNEKLFCIESRHTYFSLRYEDKIFIEQLINNTKYEYAIKYGSKEINNEYRLAPIVSRFIDIEESWLTGKNGSTYDKGLYMLNRLIECDIKNEVSSIDHTSFFKMTIGGKIMTNEEYEKIFNYVKLSKETGIELNTDELNDLYDLNYAY